MKSLSNILLYVFSALAVIAAAWVILTPGALDAETMWSPDSTPVTFIIIVTMIAFFLAVAIFVIYKIIDIFKHPSHTKEAIYVSAAVLIALVIGFIFSGSGEVIYGNGEVYDGGTASKLIGTGIIATLVLLVGAIVFMVIDTVSGLIKS